MAHRNRTVRWQLGGLSLFVGLAGCGHPITAASPQPKPAVGQRLVSPLFDPNLKWLLDEPARDKWQKPKQIVDALQIQPGESVADVGAGTGYLTRYLSQAVGRTGKVYAEEVQQEFLPALKRKAAPLGNVKVVFGTVDDPKLPNSDIDCFVLLTVYHEVKDPVAFLRTLRRSARPNARLAIIDFDANRHGDPPAPAGHDVATDDVIAEAQAAGWELAERHEFISSQFFLVFHATGK